MRLTSLIVGCLCCAAVAFCQGKQDRVDWKQEFEQGASSDENVKEMVRQRSDKVYNQVCQEKLEDLRDDLSQVVLYLQSKNPATQIQSSGLFFMVTLCRKDTSDALASFIPALRAAAADPKLAIRLRFNCVSILANLQPETRPDLFDLFRNIFEESSKGGPARLFEPAASGLARLSSINPEASQLLHQYLRHPRGADLRIDVVDALGRAQTHDQTLIKDLGFVLNDSSYGTPSPILSSHVVRAIYLIGKEAISINKAELNLYIKRTQDRQAARMVQ